MAGDSCKVYLEEVVKNNHIVRQAVVIMEKDRKISPTIYLEKFYSDFMAGRNLMEICLEIMVVHEKYRDDISFNPDTYTDYAEMRKMLYVKVINAEKNRELLESVPWRKCYDLAMTVYILLKEDNGAMATINVSNKNLLMWNIDSERLFSDAIDNTNKNMRPRLERLGDIMKEILKEKFEQCADEQGADEELDEALRIIDSTRDNQMYVLTNQWKSNGAVYIGLQDILMMVAEKIEDDIYILPSSVHELLIVPKKYVVSKSQLEKMVREINESEVDPGEVLSDTVYEYCRGKGILWKK